MSLGMWFAEPSNDKLGTYQLVKCGSFHPMIVRELPISINYVYIQPGDYNERD